MPDLRDSYKQTVSFVFTLTFNKAGQQPTSRTLTIDYIYNNIGEEGKEYAGSFRQLLLGKFNKFLQPNGWRDTDRDEDAWTITEVDVKMINKLELVYDYNEE